MKILYIILFFASSLLLLFLTFYLLKIIAKGIGQQSLALRHRARVVNIAFLVFFLYSYEGFPVQDLYLTLNYLSSDTF